MGGFRVVEIDGVQPTAAGRLPVSNPPPEPPPGTQPVARSDRVGDGDVVQGSPQTTTFQVPENKKLVVTRLIGAAENSISGSRIDLLHDDGTTQQRLTAPLFLNGATQAIELNVELTEGSVLLTRTNLSGQAVFIYAEWDGYTEDVT